MVINNDNALFEPKKIFSNVRNMPYKLMGNGTVVELEAIPLARLVTLWQLDYTEIIWRVEEVTNGLLFSSFPGICRLVRTVVSGVVRWSKWVPSSSVEQSWASSWLLKQKLQGEIPGDAGDKPNLDLTAQGAQ